MKKFILLVALLFFSQVLSAPMSCSGQGAVLSADTMSCGPSIPNSEAHSGGPNGPRIFNYNLYCKSNCQRGAVKLDAFSSLKQKFGSFICQRNANEAATALRFGKKYLRKFATPTKPNFGIKDTSSNCPCSALMFVFNFFLIFFSIFK